MTPGRFTLRRGICGVLVAAFVALLLFPLFQQRTQLPADRPLIGVRESTAKLPALTARNWLNGKYSGGAETWVRERAGLRGWLVTINRQIRYSLFGQVAPAPLPRRAVVIGEDPVIHENIYLAEALRRPVVAPEKMEAFGANLARVQALLAEQGAAFLVVLAPQKALLYPDTLPGWARDRAADDNADFPAFLEALRRHGVAHLDTMALFRQMKATHPDVVAPHSAHWSFHGAWVALQHAVPIVNRQEILPELPALATEELIMQQPLFMDDELRLQLNLLFGAHLAPVPAAYPVAGPLGADNEQKLDVLVVGDSYGFGLMDALARSRLCSRIQFLYYLRTAYEAAPGLFDSRRERVLSATRTLGLFRNSNENGQRFLTGKRLVILVMTSFNIDKFGWGFDRMVERRYGVAGAQPPPADEPPVNVDE